MKKIALLTTIAATALLASCTTTDDQRIAAAKAYDKLCVTEPPLYDSFVAVATAKGVSERTLLRAQAIHEEIQGSEKVVGLCQTRPTDPVVGLVTLSGAYARFVALNASIK